MENGGYIPIGVIYYICFIYISWILLLRQPILDGLIYFIISGPDFWWIAQPPIKRCPQTATAKLPPGSSPLAILWRHCQLRWVQFWGMSFPIYRILHNTIYNVYLRERWDTLTLVKSWESKVLNCMIQLVVYIFKKKIDMCFANEQWAILMGCGGNSCAEILDFNHSPFNLRKMIIPNIIRYSDCFPIP